jgi:hypothetical protein
LLVGYSTMELRPQSFLALQIPLNQCRVKIPINVIGNFMFVTRENGTHSLWEYLETNYCWFN